MNDSQNISYTTS